MPSAPLSRDNDYKFPPAPSEAFLDRATWDAVMGSEEPGNEGLAPRMRALEAKRVELQAIIDDLRLFGLQRLDIAISPLIEAQTLKLEALAANIDAEILRISALFASFEGQTQAALTDLDQQVAAALSAADYTISTTLAQLQADIATIIAGINAQVAAVQQTVDTILADGIPAANVQEDAGRVFVTPAQRTEIGQLRADLTAIVGGAPGALDTLNELAAALGDDANFAGTVTTALANRYTKTEADGRFERVSAKNQANGYAGLDGSGRIVGDGSQLLNLPGLGIGQTWQAVTRTFGTSYQNTTGKPIVLSAYYYGNGANAGYGTISVSLNNQAWLIVARGLGDQGPSQIYYGGVMAVIPPGHYYKFESWNTSAVTYVELR